jgi:hypothetical protein
MAVAAEAREVTDVRRRIAEEREQLGEAVDELEQTVAKAVGASAKIGGKVLIVAAGAFVLGFALAGGLKTAKRLRRREEHPRRSVAARVGRYALVRLR